MTALTISKRGTIALTASLRRKLGWKKTLPAKLQVEERADGVLLLMVTPASAPQPVSPAAKYLDRSAQALAKRAEFIRQANAACTPAFRKERLRINAQYPIHGSA